MSCNYADGLSPYDNKGVLGVAEKFETPEIVEEKCKTLADWIARSNHVVVHTGAGISTFAGIPDFRGPNGVWTLEQKGLKPTINTSFNSAIPTKTHMALKKLLESGYIKYLISQNIDGLHLRTGVPRENISELHGNMFTEQCASCKRQFIRSSATTSVGQKPLGSSCLAGKLTGRGCRGKLHDTVLDWEASLPEDDLEMAEYHSGVADLSICLGTTLQIVPSGKLPLIAKRNGGRLAIVNLQPTNLDKKADLLINAYVDDVIIGIMKQLSLEIPDYIDSVDPTKSVSSSHVISWNFRRDDIGDMKQVYTKHNRQCKRVKLERNGKLFKYEKKNGVLKDEIKNKVKHKKEGNGAESESQNKLTEVKTENQGASSGNPKPISQSKDDLIKTEGPQNVVNEVQEFLNSS